MSEWFGLYVKYLKNSLLMYDSVYSKRCFPIEMEVIVFHFTELEDAFSFMVLMVLYALS